MAEVLSCDLRSANAKSAPSAQRRPRHAGVRYCDFSRKTVAQHVIQITSSILVSPKQVAQAGTFWSLSAALSLEQSQGSLGTPKGANRATPLESWAEIPGPKSSRARPATHAGGWVPGSRGLLSEPGNFAMKAESEILGIWGSPEGANSAILCWKAGSGIPGPPEPSEPHTTAGSASGIRDEPLRARCWRVAGSLGGSAASAANSNAASPCSQTPAPGAGLVGATFPTTFRAEPWSLGTHLRGHHALSFSNKVALLALAVAPHAEALVALERRRVAVVPASRALGKPRGLLAPRAQARRPRAAATPSSSARGCQ